MKSKSLNCNTLLESNNFTPINNSNFNLLQIHLLIEKHYCEKPINSICLIHDGRLATSSEDTSIKIFNFTDYSLDLSLEGHTNSVTNLSLLNNQYLLSSSKDKTIKLWEITLTNYRCIQTLIGHKDIVFQAIELSNNRIASCSSDSTIKIWEGIIPFQCIKNIACYSGWVKSILELKNKKYIISIGFEKWDEILYFLNSSTYECYKKIGNISVFSSNCLKETETGKIILGGEGEISIINSMTFQFETKIIFNRFKIGYFTSVLFLNNFGLVFGDREGKIITIDSKEYRKTSKKTIHKGKITGLLIINDDKLVTCSSDKSIKLWKI